MTPVTTHDTTASPPPKPEVTAFVEVLRVHDRSLRSLVWSVVRDQHAIDDVLQAAYEKAFRSLDQFDGRSQMSTWLHSICYRTAIDHVRYEGRRRHADLDEARMTASSALVDDQVIAGAEFAAAMDRLDRDQRVALMLTAGLGYSFDDAAEITGMRRGTLASKASRARKSLVRWELA